MALVLAASEALADEKAKLSPYGTLHSEWKADKQALADEFPNPSANQQTELKKRSGDLRSRYTARFLELAKEHSADEDTWQQCLIWICVEGVPGNDFDAMFDFLREHAKELRETVNLQLLMSEFIPLSSERIDPALRDLAANHPATNIRGAALYALGARLKSRGEEAGSSDTCAEAQAALRRVLEDFPDVRTYRGEIRKKAQQLLDDLRGPHALGQIAPEIEGRDHHGVEFSLKSLRGKIVVLSFSGHWCSPCRLMHPIEKQLVRAHAPHDFELVEINSDKNQKAVAAKMLQDELPWRCVMDGSTEGPIATDWQIQAWPAFYVLDREHRIRYKATGDIGDKLARWVNELISGIEKGK
jgi:thiol-disulfide isomerase/thioredoxin